VLKLKCDVLLSTSAFKISLRRYTKDDVEILQRSLMMVSRMSQDQGSILRDLALATDEDEGQELTLVHFSAQRERFLREGECV